MNYKSLWSLAQLAHIITWILLVTATVILFRSTVFVSYLIVLQMTIASVQMVVLQFSKSRLSTFAVRSE